MHVSACFISVSFFPGCAQDLLIALSLRLSEILEHNCQDFSILPHLCLQVYHILPSGCHPNLSHKALLFLCLPQLPEAMSTWGSRRSVGWIRPEVHTMHILYLCFTTEASTWLQISHTLPDVKSAIFSSPGFFYNMKQSFPIMCFWLESTPLANYTEINYVLMHLFEMYFTISLLGCLLY